MPEPREDFPISTLSHMEQLLGGLRRRLMLKAAELARAECDPSATVYTVTAEHINRTWEEEFGA